MNIPLINLKAQYQCIKEEIETKVLEVISSQNFVLGSEVELLEKEIASLHGVKFGIGVSSGTDALLASLMALEIGPGHAVLTTPFTFFSTAGAVARTGARPVFSDIERKTFNLAPAKAEESIKREKKKSPRLKIKAMVPVHLFGQCADMDPLLSMAKRHGMVVIEDAAQAIGADYPSSQGIKKAGAMGTAGILSFYPTKNLGAYGDGGMILTDDKDLALKLKQLRVHGERARYFYDSLGGNFRLDAIQAGILRVKLRHLEKWQQKRKEIAFAYQKKFEEAGLLARDYLEPPVPVYNDSGANDCHTYHQYVIRTKNRDRLYEFLKKQGVGTAIFYPLPLHLQKCFAFLGYKKGDFPESEKAAREALSLPVYPELTPEQQDHIVACLCDFFKK